MMRTNYTPYQRKPRSPLPIDEVKRLYCEEEMSAIGIAKLFNVSDKVVIKHLATAEVPIRSYSQSAKVWRRKSGRALELGDKRIGYDGYVHVKVSDDPRGGDYNYKLEHILVWEQVHNKPLPKGWLVHHLNGIKSDNRPSNLEGMPRKEHYRVLALKAQRIRELEVEVRLLQRALEANQSIFYTEN